MTNYPMLDEKLAALRHAIEGGIKADSMQGLKLMELVDAIGEQFKRELAKLEMSPEFTDSARAALVWVLYHHQGGSSPVGQPIRFALGMGAHDPLKPTQIGEALKLAQKCHFPAARELPTAPPAASEQQPMDEQKPARYFVYDPEDGCNEFKTDEERQKAHQEAIDGYLDDGWSEEVTQVVSGIVTHKTVQTNLERRPAACAHHPEHDDDDCDACIAWSEYPDHNYETCCQYEPALIRTSDNATASDSAEGGVA